MNLFELPNVERKDHREYREHNSEADHVSSYKVLVLFLWDDVGQASVMLADVDAADNEECKAQR